MVQVYLEQQDSWYRDDVSGYVKGWAFHKGNLLKGKSLLDYLARAFLSGDEHFKQTLQALNGFFSIILTTNEEVILISDKLKSYPLLYFQEDGKFFVCNQGEVPHKRMKSIRINETFMPTFLALGYLWGNNTLYEQCHIVPGSTYVRIKEDVALPISYAKKPALSQGLTEEEIARKADIALMHSFERLSHIAPNRPVVLPLSGGYDSRLLACLCKKFGFRHVICYTYGIKGNPETEISRQIARQLGYPWYYVEYTTEKWASIIRNGYVESYLRFAGNLNAIGHLQDFLAIHELRHKGVIPPDSIIVPGHTGDMLGGSHLPLDTLTPSNLPLSIYEKYYELNILKPTYKAQALALLNNNLPQDITSEEECLQAFYDWGKNARQSNFIINSVRAYEFQGWEWALPLWDDEYAQFWESIPCERRKGSALYNRFLFRHYFMPFHVEMEKPNRAPSAMHGLLARFLDHDGRSIIKHYLEKYHLKSTQTDDYALDNVGDLLEMHYSLPKKNTNRYIRMVRRGSMSQKALLYLSMIGF